MRFFQLFLKFQYISHTFWSNKIQRLLWRNSFSRILLFYNLEGRNSVGAAISVKIGDRPRSGQSGSYALMLHDDTQGYPSSKLVIPNI